MHARSWHARALTAAVLALGLVAAACGSSTPATETATGPTGDAAVTPATEAATPTPAKTPPRPLRISAIPDAAPEKLQQINSALAAYLGSSLGVEVEYVAVNDYAAAVGLFRAGDLDLVWFGGLTGVQARLQTPGAAVLAQRDIDADFHSVFIANSASGVVPFTDLKGLEALKGLRFTFGSESSTSGRTMPEYFLSEAGIDPTKDFSGPVGFSGSHDKTIDLVLAGTYEAGVVNEQVWKRRVDAGTADPATVAAVFRSPGYHDYHWLAGPGVDEAFGAGFVEKVLVALLAADRDPKGTEALTLLGAKSFVPGSAGDYAEIEQIGRKLGLIT